MKEKKDPVILEDFSLSSSSFPFTVTRAFPWTIKGKAGRPIKGMTTHYINSDWNPSNLEPIRTHKHTAGK